MKFPVDGLRGSALREAATTELRQMIELVRAALAPVVRPGVVEPYVHVEAMYPDRVIVEKDGRYYAYPYTINADNTVAIGDAAEVVEQYAPVREAVLIEAAADSAGRVWRIWAIRSGQSINGTIYPDAVLRESAPLFDGARVFVKSDAEHIAGQGKDVRNLVGGLKNARFVEGATPNTGGIQADFHLLESSGLAAKLVEMQQRGMTGLMGFSIDAKGRTKKVGNLREAVTISKVVSLDMIVEPSAGGEIINLIESVNPHLEAEMALRERMIETVKAAHKGTLPAGLDINNDDALETAYREAIAPAPAAAPAATDNGQLAAIQARLDAAEMREAIAGSGLPAIVQDKLRKQIERGATVESLREAISDEKETLARLTEAGHVRGLGADDAHVSAGQDRADKVSKMWDDFFDPAKGTLSLREAYIETTGDRGVTGKIRDCDLTRLREATGANLREAVSAATFDQILGDSITRAMLREYAQLTAYDDMGDLVDIVPIRDFRTNRRTRVGGYGNLPAVAENGSYNPLTTPTDEEATYVISKRGGTETVSIEAIANDDVGVIRRLPGKLAYAAKRTLFEFVLDFLATNPTIYDTTALFTVGHGNLGATALGAASFAAARLAMKQRTEKDSAKKLGLILRHLYVPAELEETAFDLFVRGTNNDETFVQSRKPMVHVVDYWTDANNWFATCDRAASPLIELGFYNGSQEPELYVQDMPSQGSLFSNDQIKYKIRHIYGGNVLDFRGFYGAIVA